MDLDSAIDRLADLPTEELIVVAKQLEEDAKKAIERRAKARTAIINRLPPHASILVGGDEVVRVKFKNKYEHDTATIYTLAPSHVEWVSEAVVPGHWKVKNTTALNNYIKALGDTPIAEALKRAVQVQEYDPQFTFEKVKGEDE